MTLDTSGRSAGREEGFQPEESMTALQLRRAPLGRSAGRRSRPNESEALTRSTCGVCRDSYSSVSIQWHREVGVEEEQTQ